LPFFVKLKLLPNLNVALAQQKIALFATLHATFCYLTGIFFGPVSSYKTPKNGSQR
jgi:hypothetical protein